MTEPLSTSIRSDGRGCTSVIRIKYRVPCKCIMLVYVKHSYLFTCILYYVNTHCTASMK